MKENKEQFHNDPWERGHYGTGSTQPPKNHGGLIAALLIMVIILGGITTFLGILNIRLFRLLELQEQKEENMQLLQPEETPVTSAAPDNQIHYGGEAILNIQCTTVTDFDAKFYSLPRGCLVTGLTEGGGADRAGVKMGDVILELNGRDVSNVESLAALLEEHQAGEAVRLLVYRPQDRQEWILNVTLDKKGEDQ